MMIEGGEHRRSCLEGGLGTLGPFYVAKGVRKLMSERENQAFSPVRQ
jgi:hypothetical protein